MKEDEKLLLKKLRERGRGLQPSALEISKSINMAYKRARYILRDKWGRKDWYDYGVSWRVGWLTRKAFCVKILRNQPLKSIAEPLVYQEDDALMSWDDNGKTVTVWSRPIEG